jgi:hypothetical protein
MSLVLFGEALATAMNSLGTSFAIAGELATTVAEGAVLGQALVKETKEAVLKIIEILRGGGGGRFLQETVNKSAIEDSLTQLIGFLNTLPDGVITAEQSTTLNEKISKVMLELKVNPMYNPEEYEAYEIEPPSNPIFKPRKIEKIPDGMELFEIVCPSKINTPAPDNSCKPCKKPIKKRKKTIKKKQNCYIN